MEIRLLTQADYPAAFALWLATPGMGLKDLDDSPEGFARYLSRNPKTCFAAVEDGILVGVVLAGHDGRRGSLHHLAVAAAHQRRGIGSALVSQALEALKAEGINKVNLVVFTRNLIGNAFWEKQGFGLREDICIRDKTLRPMVRMDT